jgi:hypothetical protein
MGETPGTVYLAVVEHTSRHWHVLSAHAGREAAQEVADTDARARNLADGTERGITEAWWYPVVLKFRVKP